MFNKPFMMNAIPDKEEDLIFIHGLADFSKSWRRLREWLEPEGYRIHFYDYPTFQNRLRISDVAAEFYEYIPLTVGNKPFRIIAHSQGGLIAEWMTLFFPPMENLKEIITIATPYQGLFLPLIARQWLDYLPFSRQQIQHLCTLSIIQRYLLRARLNPSKCRVPFFSIIGYYRELMGIESDMVVTVCEANPNFLAYRLDSQGLRELTVPQTDTVFIHSHHLPLSFLQPEGEKKRSFRHLLTKHLQGEEPDWNYHPVLHQTALVIPAEHRHRLQLASSIRRIHSLPTEQQSYELLFLELPEGHEMTIHLENEPIRVMAGMFTYVLPDPFFNESLNQENHETL